MNNDNIAGTAKKIEGSVESALGTVTGNKSAEFKGDAKRVSGAAQSAFGRAEEYVSDSLDSVKKGISNSPVQSAFIALAAGFILGKIFRL